MAKIIVLGAMKGGVGKSVSTYNLAYSLKKLGKKVLVVDFDSSANITRCVVEDIKTVEISIGDLMMNQMDEEEQPNPAEYIVNRKGVDFIPSSDEDAFEEEPCARIAVMYAVAYLYEHREDAEHHALTLSLRSLLFGCRQEGF